MANTHTWYGSVLLVVLSAWLGLADRSVAQSQGADELDTTQAVPTSPPLAEFTVDGSRIDIAKVEHFTAQIDGRELEAVRIAVPPVTLEPWHVQVRAGNTEALQRGDAVLIRFYVRCEYSMTGEGYVQVVHEKASEDYDKSTSSAVSASPKWQRIDIPFGNRGDFAAGEAQINFQLGFGDQTIEIAGPEVLNFKDTVRARDLPRTTFSYPGRSLDAPWREAAVQRIEQLRKGDLTISLADPEGNPVSGAEVEVEMTRHAFPFGTAVAARMILEENTDGQKYKEHLLGMFNEAVFENAMKWKNHDTATPEEIDITLGWLLENGFDVRGHVLIWPSWRNMADEARELEEDKEALRAFAEQRVRDAATLYSGRLVDWDVINEPYSNHDMMDIFGDEIMADWFRIARESDPNAVLYINDFGILSGGMQQTEHQRHYHEVIGKLISYGAPIQAIGMQGHFSSNLTPPQRLIEILDWYSEYGLPIKITEFDMDIRGDRELQADYMRDFLTVMFSHPNVIGVLNWGFWEDRHWRPETAFFDTDWTLRPHGQVWLDMVYDQWWTRESITSDSNGAAEVRGFLGQYEVTVRLDGQEWKFDTQIDGPSSEVRFVLE